METKAKSKKLFGIIGIVAVACVAIIAFIAINAGSGGRSLEKQLELGAKYLDELQYEQAVVAYEVAIQIDRKCVDAYLGLADTYEAMGEPVNAAQTLVFAYVNVDENDRGIIESTFNELAGTYEEVQDAISDGSLELGGEVSDEKFDEFFNVPEDGQDSGNTSTGNNNGASAGREESGGYVLFGKHFKEWTYDTLLSYIQTNSVEISGKYMLSDEAGNTIAVATVTGYRDVTNANEIKVDTEGMCFTFGEKTDGNGTSWTITGLSEEEMKASDHVIAGILGSSAKSYVDNYGEGTYNQALQSDEPVFLGDIYIMINEVGNVSIGSANEVMGLHPDESGMIRVVSFFYMGSSNNSSTNADESASNSDSAQEQNVSQNKDDGKYFVDDSQYQFLGMKLSECTFDSLASYIRANGSPSPDNNGWYTLSGYTNSSLMVDEETKYITGNLDNLYVSFSEYDDCLAWDFFDMNTYDGREPSFAMLGQNFTSFVNSVCPGLYEEFVNSEDGYYNVANLVCDYHKDGNQESANILVNIDNDLKLEQTFGLFAENGVIESGSIIYYKD